MEKEYFLEIEKETIVYVHFLTEKGEVTEFVAKLLCKFGGKWYEVIRFDSGHECPHKDILNREGDVIRKIWYEFLDNGQALTIAIADIKDNFSFYKERFHKCLKVQ